MTAKLRMEMAEYRFVRKLVLLLVIFYVVARVNLTFFRQDYPTGCIGEFIVYVLDNYYVTLVLFPILFLIVTCGKSNEVCRYPILLKYKSRNEFLCIRLLGKLCFGMVSLPGLVGVLFLVGNKLPRVSEQAFLFSADIEKIMIRQCLNIFCYLCLMIFVHEIFQSIIGTTAKDLVITSTVPILNLAVVKLQITRVVLWTPWGNMAYFLEGKERSGYRFFWWYWAFVLMLLFYVADILNRRKDYVFEKDNKTY